MPGRQGNSWQRGQCFVGMKIHNAYLVITGGRWQLAMENLCKTTPKIPENFQHYLRCDLGGKMEILCHQFGKNYIVKFISLFF